MPLATSAPEVTSPVTNITTNPIATYEGIPWKLMEHYSITPIEMSDTVKNKLKDAWEFFETDDPEETLTLIAETERKIGHGGQNMLDKIWHYAKIHKQIQLLERQKEALYGG